ncbi:MAG: hypothetical protein ABJ275_10110 [Maricaulaceae bacterium]
MRYLSLLLPLMLIAAPATAHPPAIEEAPKTLEEVLTAKSDNGLNLKDKLPSDEKIEEIIADLPDFNHLLDGVLKIAQDEKIREKISNTATHMKSEIDKSGALEPRENGLPDINTGLAVLLRSLSDKDGIGGMLEVLEEVGGELETVMQESIDKENDESDS